MQYCKQRNCDPLLARKMHAFTNKGPGMLLSKKNLPLDAMTCRDAQLLIYS